MGYVSSDIGDLIRAKGSKSLFYQLMQFGSGEKGRGKGAYGVVLTSNGVRDVIPLRPTLLSDSPKRSSSSNPHQTSPGESVRSSSLERLVSVSFRVGDRVDEVPRGLTVDGCDFLACEVRSAEI